MTDTATPYVLATITEVAQRRDRYLKEARDCMDAIPQAPDLAMVLELIDEAGTALIRAGHHHRDVMAIAKRFGL